MIRFIFIFITLFTLTACGQDETEVQHESMDKHTEEKNHKDEEHHDKGNVKDHADHDEHKDTEHHDEAAGEHKEEDGGHEEVAGTVHLKPEQMKAANIIVKPLSLTDVALSVRAPGEIKLNAYRTVKVSPRISAQVIERHSKLGDEVVIGQPLVTLSSVEMADAQGQLLLSDKEWKRVKKLGRKVVSEKRYITAKVGYQKSYANAKAFGMSEVEIKALLAEKRSADGSFKMVSQQAGRVLHDKFIVGEYIEAGYELMVIADESTMWVEARVTPDVAGKINVGNNAEILLNKQRLQAKVIQLHHTLDETTRTSAVRIEVDNDKDQLHAGMFVTALIATSNNIQSIQIPEAAVLRSSDGDWQIFVEQDKAGEFKAVEVEVKQISDGKAIIEGIKAGTRVVTHGAFFVQSELAKSGFEIHNH